MSTWRGPYICSIYSLLLAPHAYGAKGCFFAKSLQSQLKAEADAVHCQHRNTCSDWSYPTPLFIGNFSPCRSLNIPFSRTGQELLRGSNCLAARLPPHHEIFPPHLPAAQTQALVLGSRAGQILQQQVRISPVMLPLPPPCPTLLLHVWPEPCLFTKYCTIDSRGHCTCCLIRGD